MRIAIKKTKVFKFDELSATAQRAALSKLGAQATEDDWWGSVYEDAKQMAEIIGIDMNHNGKNPCIWFSGFSSQGDGACFEGSYRYRKGALRELRQSAPAEFTGPDGEHHTIPSNAELQRIAKALQMVQARYLYQLEATVRHRGHYYHSGCTNIEVSHATYHDIGEAEEEITTLLRDFMEWIYRQLEDEHDYLTSEAALKEAIEANEYEFTEDGEIY